MLWWPQEGLSPAVGCCVFYSAGNVHLGLFFQSSSDLAFHFLPLGWVVVVIPLNCSIAGY